MDEYAKNCIQGIAKKEHKLKDRFRKEIREALKQISGYSDPLSSPHDYESLKIEAVVAELCDRLVNITDDQLSRAIYNFDW